MSQELVYYTHPYYAIGLLLHTLIMQLVYYAHPLYAIIIEWAQKSYL